MHPTIQEVTDRIRARSATSRAGYLQRLEDAASNRRPRSAMGCSNLAHGMAACDAAGKETLAADQTANLAIVTAYNDMLSAHQPYEHYPARIRHTARLAGGNAQVAGGVPAMCDGVTQGREGMELSLFSRDVIALSTAVALSHDMYDAALYLGVCDKIVPGLLIGALSFGHLPAVFVPAGPMPSGLPNREKAAVREAFAAGTADRKQLLAAESASYHAPGTCTFYGTANSNQMLLEFMGLQLPGSSFEPPGSAMRDALTDAATLRALDITHLGNRYMPIGRIVDERCIVNAMIGLLATGGSTNHTIHLIAIAAAAGISIDWSDFSRLGSAVPLLASVYPNGAADVNQFHAAGGIGFVIAELLANERLHENVPTILGHGLEQFTRKPSLDENGRLQWRSGVGSSADRSVLRTVQDPFQSDGGIRVLEGNIGQAVAKVSAVQVQHQTIQAPARVFRSQEALLEAYEAGALDGDFVAVVTHQGPAANGMPELHKLSPVLGTLQNRGQRVALLTDGRMSGASGKVLSAIQVSPEAREGGLIGRIQDGDTVEIDAADGRLLVHADLASRPVDEPVNTDTSGVGRDLFRLFRSNVGPASRGASIFSALP
jgi:phosphogluconate dehydratase